MSKMNLIMEGWRRFLKEAEEKQNPTPENPESEPEKQDQQPAKDVTSQVIEIVKKNPFISKYAESLDDKKIIEKSNFYYLDLYDDFFADPKSHLKNHFGDTAGSKWTIGVGEVKELLKKTLDKPYKTVSEPFKDAKTGQVKSTTKLKWLNQKNNSPVGVDSLVKANPDEKGEEHIELEPFGMVDRVKDWATVSNVVKNNNYELVTQDGKEYTEDDLKNNIPGFIKQNIAIRIGKKENNKTNFYNLIVVFVSEEEKVNGKPIVSLATIFPGMQPVDENGKDITNKKDYAKHGYLFLKDKPSDNMKENKMKITKQYLKRIIKEELQKALKENDDYDDYGSDEPEQQPVEQVPLKQLMTDFLNNLNRFKQQPASNFPTLNRDQFNASVQGRIKELGGDEGVSDYAEYIFDSIEELSRNIENNPISNPKTGGKQADVAGKDFAQLEKVVQDYIKNID